MSRILNPDEKLQRTLRVDGMLHCILGITRASQAVLFCKILHVLVLKPCLPKKKQHIKGKDMERADCFPLLTVNVTNFLKPEIPRLLFFNVRHSL